MPSKGIRHPTSINPTVIKYDNRLKVRFRLFIGGVVFSLAAILCCPILIVLPINVTSRANSTATQKQISYTTATDVVIVTTRAVVVTKTPKSTSSTSTPHITRTSTSQPNRVAKISCANKIYKVNLRRTPGYQNKNDSTDSIYEIPCGESVELLGETEYVDGLTWWKIRWNNRTGWIADQTASGKTILIFDP